MTKRQIFGLVSRALLFIGVFFPVVQYNVLLGASTSSTK